MFKKRNTKDKVLLFLKGLAMGSANKVPGVSGGAVAFVLGFYEELVYTFRKVNYKAFKLLVNGRVKSFLQYLNISFLLLVMGGSLFSYFSVSIVLDYLLKHYEIHVWSTFFGMILGSIYHISRNYEYWNVKILILVFFGFFIGLSLSYLPPATENSNLWFVFLCGIIGVSGMTIPGLSGSFLLMLLGNYVLLLVDSVNVVFNVTRLLLLGRFEVLDVPSNIQYLKIAITFFLGSFFGLVSLSHLLGYVLKKWNHIVTALIIGFIAGSLGIVWPWKEKVFSMADGTVVVDHKGNQIIENYIRYFPDLTQIKSWTCIGYILLGFLIVLGIDFYERKRKTDTVR